MSGIIQIAIALASRAGNSSPQESENIEEEPKDHEQQANDHDYQPFHEDHVRESWSPVTTNRSSVNDEALNTVINQNSLQENEIRSGYTEILGAETRPSTPGFIPIRAFHHQNSSKSDDQSSSSSTNAENKGDKYRADKSDSS